MVAKALSLLDGLPAVLALGRADAPWQATLDGSLPARLYNASRGFLTRKGGSVLARVGSCLHLSSFILMMVLILALGLPQFASDKEGLAVIVAAAVGMRIIGSLAGGREEYKTSAIDLVVLVYLAVNVLAAASSHYFVPSLKGLAKVVVYVAAYFLFVSCLRAAANRPVRCLLALVAGSLPVVLYGLYQYKMGVAPLATWEDPSVEIKATRIYSTLGNPNLLAGYLVPVAPVAAALGFSFMCMRKWPIGLPLLVAFAVTVVATLLTGSRAGFLGLAAGVSSLVAFSALWLWKGSPRARWMVVATFLSLPLAFAGALYAVPGFKGRLTSIFSFWEHSSNAFRLNVWHASWQMFLDNWWIGVGPGNQAFRLAYGLYMRSGFDALGTYCVPLEIMVETGLPGLVVFACLIVAVLARAHCLFWQSTSASDRWFVAGVAAALIGMMVQGLADTVFYRPQVQLIFWLLVASVVALSRREEVD